MKKFEKFLETQTLQETVYGVGYVITFGELIDNGGKNEFFRMVLKCGNKVAPSKSVYHGLEYDRSRKVWEAQNYFDISSYKVLKRNSKIFVGFTF